MSGKNLSKFVISPGKLIQAYGFCDDYGKTLDPDINLVHDLNLPEYLFAPGEWAAAWNGWEAISRMDKAIVKYWADRGVKP